MCGFPLRFNLGILVDLDVFPAFSDARFCEIRHVIAVCAAGDVCHLPSRSPILYSAFFSP
jgi:hypothetical protein